MTIPGRPDGQPYRICRVIGNNYVLTHDDGGREIILRGLGIGFKNTRATWFRRAMWSVFTPCAARNTPAV